MENKVIKWWKERTIMEAYELQKKYGTSSRSRDGLIEDEIRAMYKGEKIK